MLLKRTSIIALLTLMLMPATTLALEFKSVVNHKTVLYDAPSASAKKILILGQYYPLEVIVNLGDWIKVRDAQGAISWIEAKNLGAKRTVMVVVNNAEIRAEASAASALLATLDKDVVLEIADAKLSSGWLKVKHRDGVTGFILVTSVWGY